MSKNEKSKVPAPKDSKVNPKPQNSQSLPFPLWIGVLVAVGSVLFYIFVLNAREECTLKHVHWERHVQMEEWKQLLLEGWKVPREGEIRKVEKRLKTDTTETPAEQDYYTYSAYVWTDWDPMTEKGIDNTPVWPKYWIDAYHRLKSKPSEQYTAKFECKEELLQYTLNSSEIYDSFLKELGQPYSVSRDSAGIQKVQRINSWLDRIL